MEGEILKMHWMKEIKVVIFDLDGTLYQDHSFYRRYLSYLVEGSEVESCLEQLIDEASQILSNQHCLKLGHLYDSTQDHVLEFNQGQIVKAQTWKGGDIGQDKFRESYSSRQVDLQDYLYAGDAWSIVGIMAKRLNTQQEKIREAFIRVRKDMISETFGILRDNSLIEAIEALTAVKGKILMTNTHAESGIEFVNYLGMNQMFDEIIYDGNKPAGIETLMQSILKKYDLQPHQVLSIGDNAWNELYPIQRMGGRTVWVSPYQSSDYKTWDHRLSKLADLSNFIRDLQLHLQLQQEAEPIK